MFRGCLWALVVVILVGSLPAAPWAEEGLPSEVRVISPTEATSKCIGNPETPICAVETLMACGERLNMALCNRVGVFDISLGDQQGTARYRVLEAVVFGNDNLPEEYRTGPGRLCPGDAEVVVQRLDVTAEWCPEGCNFSYWLKNVRRNWMIDGWAMWGAE